MFWVLALFTCTKTPVLIRCKGYCPLYWALFTTCCDAIKLENMSIIDYSFRYCPLYWALFTAIRYLLHTIKKLSNEAKDKFITVIALYIGLYSQQYFSYFLFLSYHFFTKFQLFL